MYADVDLVLVSVCMCLLMVTHSSICTYVSFVWQELTDVDILHESEEGADSMIDALLGQQICALLVQNLERLDETVKEEAEGVHNTLGGYSGIPEVTQNC